MLIIHHIKLNSLYPLWSIVSFLFLLTLSSSLAILYYCFSSYCTDQSLLLFSHFSSRTFSDRTDNLLTCQYHRRWVISYDHNLRFLLKSLLYLYFFLGTLLFCLLFFSETSFLCGTLYFCPVINQLPKPHVRVGN